MKALISFEEFLEAEKKLEIEIGQIAAVDRINKKMLKLSVNFGGPDHRTVVTNIGNKVVDEQTLVGVQLPFITNLQPAMISGFESQAMIMVPEDVDGAIHFPPATNHFSNGAKLL